MSFEQPNPDVYGVLFIISASRLPLWV